MSFQHRITLSLLIVIVLLAGCTGTARQAPTSTVPAQPAVSSTPEPAATTAPQPTVPPEPTKAPEPTRTSEPTKAPEPTKTLEPSAPTGKAGYDLLMEAARAQLAQKAWRATLTSDDGGQTSKSVIEYVAPDRFHLALSAGPELIIVKEGSYLKQGDKWTKSPVDMGGMLTELLSQQSLEEMTKDMSLDQLRFIGLDTINGKPMWVYEYTSSMKVGDTAITSRAKVWIGVTDRLVYRMESEADSAVNKGGKTKIVIVYDYDPSIRIEAPVG